MTDEAAERGEVDKPAVPALPPQRQRPKMTLGDQSSFLINLLRRCVMTSDPRIAGTFAKEAVVTLTQDDMLKLEAIQQTIAFMDLHDVGRLVREDMSRKARQRARS